MQKVTAGEAGDADPSWSPDGDALAFGGIFLKAAGMERHPIRIVDLRSHTVTALPDSSRSAPRHAGRRMGTGCWRSTTGHLRWSCITSRLGNGSK